MSLLVNQKNKTNELYKNFHHHICFSRISNPRSTFKDFKFFENPLANLSNHIRFAKLKIYFVFIYSGYFGSNLSKYNDINLHK